MTEIELEEMQPTAYVRDLSNISPDAPILNGVEWLVVDWDGTICDTNEDVSIPNVQAIWEWHAAGRIKGFAILTNSAFARKQGKEKRIRRILADVGLTPSAVLCLGRHNRKPRAEGFQDALVALGCTKNQVAMIGDQLVSDIWGANRLGWKTILVDHYGGYMWANLLSGRAIRNWLVMRKLGLVPSVYHGQYGQLGV